MGGVINSDFKTRFITPHRFSISTLTGSLESVEIYFAFAPLCGAKVPKVSAPFLRGNEEILRFLKTSHRMVTFQIKLHQKYLLDSYKNNDIIYAHLPQCRQKLKAV